MTKYEFGVVSHKYSLEADDENVACITMALFIERNLPIAIYLPIKKAFMPKDILEANKDNIKKNVVMYDAIKQCFNTIQELTH